MAAQGEDLHGESRQQEQGREGDPAGQVKAGIEERRTVGFRDGFIAVEDGVHVHPGDVKEDDLKALVGLHGT